ncbi:aminotransferase class V-fold PLP-dependent enzyme [Catellatospora chokoriensis]|uniref:Cysteine desulfurase n=1 Tax=Catellatospora chokoriensis TaxID=310353 RepID=A0A8J3JVJ8_9ACTN|nr:aminotransferase class V-fold PLP-dependent enzyme [Catellatospora chokoriensis]GIF87653.1 cysteine desulfurase [Catellatospora chokoriensis]
MIYLDHAATSYPKPAPVREAILACLAAGGNPGRSGHRLAIWAEERIWDARERIADLFHTADASRVVFTVNATMALNVAIKGLARPRTRVLTSSFEHNSVTRPLWAMKDVTWTAIAPTDDSPIDLDLLEQELRKGGVAMVVVSHASNVTGAVVPLAQIRSLTGGYEVPLVLDASQTAGHLPVRAEAGEVLVFPGHKGLFGPQGTGGMVVGDGITLHPLVEGGTGGRSESPRQPRWLPHALEAGTPNSVGIAGLGAAVQWLTECGIEAIMMREASLRAHFIARLRAIPRLTVHDWASETTVPVVSIAFDDMPAAEAAARLEERADVIVRAGLHCAPLAHRTLGTLPAGTVRFGLSHLTDLSELESALDAVADLAGKQ